MLERIWGKRNSSILLVGQQTCTVRLEISMVVSQNIRKLPTSRPSNTTLVHILKGCQSYHKDMCSNMFIAALFVIARTWKYSRCPSIYKEKVAHLYNEVTVVQNNDILKVEGKLMDLKKKKHSEVIQTQKDKYNIYSFRSDFWTQSKEKTAYSPQSQRTQTTKRTLREAFMDLIMRK